MSNVVALFPSDGTRCARCNHLPNVEFHLQNCPQPLPELLSVAEVRALFRRASGAQEKLERDLALSVLELEFVRTLRRARQVDDVDG